MKKIFTRYPKNPSLTKEDFPVDTSAVLNPGAIKTENEYVLICDVTLAKRHIVLWVARSQDGIHFVPDEKPIELVSHPDHPNEICVYDPRIVKLEGRYYITHTSNSIVGDRISLLATDDFRTFERVSVSSELNNRNCSLFPEKINGYYCRFGRDEKDLWIEYSPDLHFWGNQRLVMQTRETYWDAYKIGAGAPPIKTEHGWLELYHGVYNTCNGYIYNLGVVMLDLEDPSKVLARSEGPVFYPEESYEWIGRVPGVVFSCNAVLEDDGTVKIYYGAADQCIGLAEAKLEDLIDACYHG